jgi:hypothetical protein
VLPEIRLPRPASVPPMKLPLPPHRCPEISKVDGPHNVGANVVAETAFPGRLDFQRDSARAVSGDDVAVGRAGAADGVVAYQQPICR